MKFVWYEKDEKKQLGVLQKEERHILSLTDLLPERRFQDLLDFIKRYTPEDIAVIRGAMEKEKPQGTPLTKVRVLSPIERPIHDIICVGVNYESHLKESTLGLKDPKLEGPKEPVYFSKRAVRILGTEEPIEGFLSLDNALDYEVELAVLIGKEGRDIPKDKVKDHIFGYTVFNDVSSRTLQKAISSGIKERAWIPTVFLDPTSFSQKMQRTRQISSWRPGSTESFARKAAPGYLYMMWIN